jgi:hypothetical protein
MIADYYGLRFQKCHPSLLKQSTEIFFDDHSLLDLNTVGHYIGSHLIRDPRDVIVSGYFYHLRTSEKWAHIPKKEYEGKTYQELLLSLDEEEGIKAEIKRASVEIKHMSSWDYNNPKIYEIRYEHIIENEETVFKELFEHYGFNDKAAAHAVQIAMSHSLKNKKPKKNSHSRSGKPGEWKTYFSENHKNYFKELCGSSLITLDYENDNNW